MASIRTPLAPAAMARSAPYLHVPAARPPASKPSPPQTFSMNYYKVPDHFMANFSTKQGRSRKRSLPDPLPAVIIRSHMDKDVVAKAAALKLEFPNFYPEVVVPRRWEDLYHYFDGYDLFVEGQEFCFHVIKLIGEENQYFKAKKTKEIDAYAAEWVMYNSHVILSNKDTSDMFSLFTQEEAMDFPNLRLWEQHLLMERLTIHRSALVKAQQALERREYEDRLPKPLFPVAENRLSPMVLAQAMAQPNDLPLGSRLAPVALQPVSHIPYNKFMHNQRMVSNPGPNQWPRNRGVSDTSRYNNGSRGPRFNEPQNARRTSPPREQPVYVLNTKPPPQYPTKFETNSQMPGNFSNDARNDPEQLIKMFRNPDKVHITTNGSATISYSGIVKHPGDNHNAHTVYVGPVDREFYVSDGLYHAMAKCGDIDTIHFPSVYRPGAGAAFVSFIEEESIGRAIRALDGQILNGTCIKVNRPHTNRLRSNSTFSQQGGHNNRSVFQTPRDFEEYRPRPQVIDGNYKHFNDGPAFAVGNFPTKVETFIPIGGTLPLIENLPPKPSMRSELDLAALAKKENAPLKRSQNSTPSSRGNSSRGNSGKKHMRSTPASTPSKSRSEVKLHGMAENAPPQMGQSNETAPPQIGQSETPVPKSKKKKNKKKSAAATPSESPSFTTDASDSFKSSTESGTMESFTSQNTSNTSAASLSRQHSRASAMSDMGATIDVVTSGAGPKQRNASGRGRKPNSQQNQPKKENSSVHHNQQSKADGEQPQPDRKEQSVQPKKDSRENSQSKQEIHSLQSKKSHEKALSKQNEQPAQNKKECIEKSHAMDHEYPAHATKEVYEKTQNKQNEQPAQQKKDGHEQLQIKEGEPALSTKTNQPKSQSSQHESQNNHKKKGSKETNENSGLEANTPTNKKEQRVQTHSKAEQHTQHAKNDEEKPRGKENKPIGKENEPPKPLKNDSTPVASQRKADSKGKGNKKSMDSGQVFPDKMAQSPPKQVHEDPLQWPALGPSLSNQSAIADGKRPPPLPAMRVVPAVPVVPKKLRPQT